MHWLVVWNGRSYSVSVWSFGALVVTIFLVHSVVELSVNSFPVRISRLISLGTLLSDATECMKNETEFWMKGMSVVSIRMRQGMFEIRASCLFCISQYLLQLLISNENIHYITKEDLFKMESVTVPSMFSSIYCQFWSGFVNDIKNSEATRTTEKKKQKISTLK